MESIKAYISGHRLQVALAGLFVLVLVLAFGLYQLFTYSLPMALGNYPVAYRSASADRAMVLYDAGLAAYREGDYDSARKLLVEAYSACTGSSGQISESKQKLASQVQFLLGNALYKTKKSKPAIEAWKQALRLDPTNLYAKYNLELLQSNNGGAASDSPDSPGGSGGGGGKKGI